MRVDYDVVVVGGGPAGSVCAAKCARAGMRTVLVERAVFPREKVCGDCVNPGCWPVIEDLGLADRVWKLPHAVLGHVELGGLGGRAVVVPLGRGGSRPGIAVRRSLFDEALLAGALAAGVDTWVGHPVVSAVFADGRWTVRTARGALTADWLVAADGRNSSICRMNRIVPRSPRNRVALQTYAALDDGFRSRVGLRIFRHGYCGYADVGEDTLNVCVVGKPRHVPRLKAFADELFRLPANPVWRSISPIERRPAPRIRRRLLLVGDAARVVEPFTGEGIRYAMRSGHLAAVCLACGTEERTVAATYENQWRALYAGRLWINGLARRAVKSPRLGDALIRLGGTWPVLLRALTAKVQNGGQSAISENGGQENGGQSAISDSSGPGECSG